MARPRSSGRLPVVIGVVVVLVLATTVIGGALWANTNKAEKAAAPIPTVVSAPDTVDVSLDRETATVLVGQPSAPVTVDVYEDFLCPACRQFEQSYGTELHEELVAGTIRVRYHLLNLLDARSDPPGYSLLAANAALAVADLAPSKFLDFFGSLLAAQPEEGARGYDAEQLVALGERLGIGDERFATAVTGGTFEPAIRRSLATAMADPALSVPGSGGASFGTPTVAVGDDRIDIGDPNWLRKLTS